MRSLFSPLAAAAFGLALAASAPAAFAAPLNLTDAERECVDACRDSQHDCVFDARESMKACLEVAGCDDLRSAYRDTCFVAGRDDEACTAARESFKACVVPCREESHASEQVCRDAVASCASESCAVALPTPRPRPEGGGHGHGPHGRGPRGRGPGGPF